MLDSFGREINYLRLSVTDRLRLAVVFCATVLTEASVYVSGMIGRVIPPKGGAGE